MDYDINLLFENSDNFFEYIRQQKRKEGHSKDDYVILEKKKHSIKNIMELASYHHVNNITNNDNFFKNQEKNYIINILQFGIIENGWSDNIKKGLEDKIIDNCLKFHYITKDEYEWLIRKKIKADTQYSVNDKKIIDNNFDFLWNIAFFKEFYKDRCIKKKKTLKIAQQSSQVLSKKMLIKHDTSLFKLSIAVGMVTYDYLTNKNSKLNLVQCAANDLMSMEKYLKFSRREDVNNKTKYKNVSKVNIIFQYINIKYITRMILILCKSASKEIKHTIVTKKDFFNLSYLFNYINIHNKKYIDYLILAYGSINIDDILSFEIEEHQGILQPINNTSDHNDINYNIIKDIYDNKKNIFCGYIINNDIHCSQYSNDNVYEEIDDTQTYLDMSNYRQSPSTSNRTQIDKNAKTIYDTPRPIRAQYNFNGIYDVPHTHYDYPKKRLLQCCTCKEFNIAIHELICKACQLAE
nr:MAG: hypothetical protein [Metapenaeopsis lamellata majanivirus]